MADELNAERARDEDGQYEAAPPFQDDDDSHGPPVRPLGEVDYYAVLNVAKTATDDEIRAAYRQMKIVYHPDKHHSSSAREAASREFVIITKAYEVLTDPKKRYIYDIYGANAVEMNWELSERYQTAEEFKREIDRKRRLQEEQKEASRSILNGSITLTLDAEEALFPYEGEPRRISMERMYVAQSMTVQLSRTTAADFSAAVLSRNGMGAGSMNGALRHQFSPKTMATLAGGIGFGQLFGVKLQRNFSKRSFASADVAYSETPRESGWGVTLHYGRQLARGLVGHIIWSALYNEQLLVNVTYNSRGSVLTGKLKLGYRDFDVSARGAYKVSRKTTVTGKLGINPQGPYWRIGLTRRFTRRSTFGMHTSYDVSGVQFELSFHRANQSFSIPISLRAARDAYLAAAAVIAPAITGSLVKLLVIAPHAEYRAKINTRRRREAQRELILRARQEYLSTVQLMAQAVAPKLAKEKEINGLVIINAQYGCLESTNTSLIEAGETDEAFAVRNIDVSVPLQMLVQESQLSIPGGRTKAGLRGFYDCAPEVDKKLHIRYLFRNCLHEVVYDDEDQVVLADESHLAGAPVAAPANSPLYTRAERRAQQARQQQEQEDAEHEGDDGDD